MPTIPKIVPIRTSVIVAKNNATNEKKRDKKENITDGDIRPIINQFGIALFFLIAIAIPRGSEATTKAMQ